MEKPLCREMTDAPNRPGSVRRTASGIATIAYVCAIVGIASSFENWALAAYALSFWHYCIYGLACGFAAVPLAMFKRDAIITKSVALVVLALLYLPSVSSPVSIAVVTSGFLLNAYAASVLGVDRTYYGHEIAGLPHERVTAFPYSVLSHPMLIGNMVAFGGLLLDPAFRRDWWPLAATHVLFNGVLLIMEVALASPGARRRLTTALSSLRCREGVALSGLLVAAGAVAGGALALAFDSKSVVQGSLLAACVMSYALALKYAYSAPVSEVSEPR